MLRKIRSIENVGQYEDFKSEFLLERNVSIFGFNGAGKSTLSDILYSLANNGKETSITKRRTLCKEGDAGQKAIKIEMESDSGEVYTFLDSSWNNQPKDMYVFNKQYIDEHVFVSRKLEGNVATIGMGSEGVRLLKQRDSLQAENSSLLNSINEKVDFLIKAELKLKDFSSSRVTEKTTLKRFEKMKNYELYPVGQEAKILNLIKRSEKYSSKERVLKNCDEKYKHIENVEPVILRNLLKTVRKVPRISSKELSNFLSHTMTNADIQWAVKGYKNQREKNKCPMCGQTISDKKAIEFFNRLGKYISLNKGEYLDAISINLHNVVSNIQGLRIEERKNVFDQIIQELDDANLLSGTYLRKFKIINEWSLDDSEILESIIKKINNKAENPYIKIDISKDELETLQKLNKCIKEIKRMDNALIDARARLERYIEKSINLDEMGKLYKLSYGESGIYRDAAEVIKNSTAKYIKNQEKLSELNSRVNDCYNQSRLNRVNDFLKKLNTHIVIEVKNNGYFIRLKDYNPKELDDSLKDTIFSEGESRAIAFAYFLSEISDVDNPSGDRIIVIDDPISSMDHSRQSIISHKVADMMNDQRWQVILMTHDISFLEKVESYLDNNVVSQKIELRSEKKDFYPFEITDYLTDDETVYRKFIKKAETSSSEIDKIIALMSLRPYAYVKKISESDYRKIEKDSTYYAHTLYCKSNRVFFKQSNYNNAKIKTYVRRINRYTKSKFDVNAIAESYSFSGFDFDIVTQLYSSINLDCMDNMRRKMLLMRPLIEACVFQLSTKNKFDAEHIGSMIKSTIRSNSSNDDRKKMCIELKELYDATKKYHHGADSGSLLGISWINPNEVEYFDGIIMAIVTKIKNCNISRSIVA